MRAISLVNRLEFDFGGNVLRNAITLRDVDNDGNYELIVGNEKGEVVIFKGKEKWQTINNLGFVCCLAVGDIFNQNRNSLVIITGDGWCHIYDSPESRNTTESVDTVDGQILSGESYESYTSDSLTAKSSRRRNINKKHLQRVHVQRIPANTKYILLDDIDGDGCIEMVLGLTDRVIRSYRWFDPFHPNKAVINVPNTKIRTADCKLIGLNKWECAKQIGSVTLHHDNENRPSLLIAQPGGTFMRIRYQHDDNGEMSDSSNSQSEYLTGSFIDYQFLGLSRMRNHNISTEIVGNLKTKKGDCKEFPYAVATLDGTIMLVQDEIILWEIAVDHQVFALTKLDVTGDGTDDLVACSWDGNTYILDQEKHSVQFQLGESVQAFDTGFYNLVAGEIPVTCFVYVTFRNSVLLYYDIPLKEMICRKFTVDLERIKDVFASENAEERDTMVATLSNNENDKRRLVEYLLYGVHM
ncbi:PREDICTED: integrin-alpha FG-GAP repeat-containing protein 2-like [Nicrophorus vespilloides]|uniref:Integrin-alpha FG-GAP repeat-containing protein 2-like n=1 Tax=Nicrophorus vespilloides TaxID=110193 RepID=A0ABM1MHZ1_NICVS|nr:PREDICTED: integrin-alpha FG-GAP repeat-containing protein 2-like [Nicrophorus vespilloides]